MRQGASESALIWQVEVRLECFASGAVEAAAGLQGDYYTVASKDSTRSMCKNVRYNDVV